MKKLSFIIIFLILFVFWFWSKNGIKINTKIIKKNSLIKIYFDNYLLGSAQDISSEEKKLKIDFSKQDLDSKYFNNQPKTEKNNIFLAKDNYELNFVLTNPFTVRLNFEGNKPYVFYFNPYRHLNSGWEDKFNVLENKVNTQVQISFINGIKWIVWIILKPFPLLIPIFILFFIIFKKIKNDLKNVKPIFLKKIILIPLVLMIVSFCWSRYLMANYLKDTPHVPDSVSYVVLGKIISSGKLTVPFSDIPSFIKAGEIKDYFFHWFRSSKNGLFVPYLLGHPLVLALGNVLGLMKYAPPLVGSITLLFIFVISFYLTKSLLFSIISMLLCLFSPFFQTQTIDYMSHNSASLFILISILPIFIDKKNTKYYLLTGFFQGMLFNTRPLIFIASFFIIILYLVIEYFEEKKLKHTLLKLLFIFLGFLIPLFIFFYYNFITSNNILTTPYQYHGILNKVGFGNDFKIGYGLLNSFSNLAVFSLFFMKNYYFSFFPLLLSFLLLPFSGELVKKIIFLQFLSLSIIGVWTLYDGNFFMYGPRFIYESVPVLTILYGSTFYILYNAFKHTKWKIISYLIFFIYFINVFSFELSWLGKKQTEYTGITYVPSNINELKNFNSVDDRFSKKISNRSYKIFLMKKCENWWCSSGFWLNQYPLNKSRPLFLSLPDNYKNEIKNAEIIDWNEL